jgi:hypothetical protein
MHFPTSLPPSTENPTNTYINVPTGSVHADLYDGPVLVPSRYRPRGVGFDSRPRQRTTSIPLATSAPQITPIFAHATPPVSGAGVFESTAAIRPIGVSSQALDGAVNSPSTSTSHHTGDVFSRIPHPAHKEQPPKYKLKGLKAAEFRKVFSKKREPSDDESPVDAEDLHRIKLGKKEVRVSDLDDRKEKKAAGGSTRARLTTRLLRYRGKTEETEPGVDLHDSEHHPFEAARQRLRHERERKMRRKDGGSKITTHSKEEAPSGGEEHHRGFSVPLSEEVHEDGHFQGSKERAETDRAKRYEEEKEELEVGSEAGNRVGNTVQRLTARVLSHPEEWEADGRRAGWAAGGESRSDPVDFLRASVSLYGNTLSSHNQDEYQAATILDQDLQPPRVPFAHQPSTASAWSPINDRHGQIFNYSMLPYEDRPAPAVNVQYNPVYPPRHPSVKEYRPTLSPVSSRSPAPTNTDSPRPTQERSQPRSSSSLKNQLLEPRLGAQSLLSPASVMAPPPTPPSILRPQGLPIQNEGLNTGSDISRPESRILSLVVEQPAPVPGGSPQASEQLLPVSNEPEDGISSLELEPIPKSSPRPSKKSPSGTSARKYSRFASSVSIRTEAISKEESSVGDTSTSSPFSEIPRPSVPPPELSLSPLKASARTPTTSALEFWREADESLAPSESASAQPPNYGGERPPAFWKSADKSLETYRASAPTMEEWIASLPGLGLGLGAWGDSDGVSDWNYFQTLRASRKLKKSRSRVSQTSEPANSTRTTEDLVDESIEKVQEALGDIGEDFPKLSTVQEGLTPDEAEAVEVSDEEPHTPVDNAPPPVADPRLLHPDYQPGSQEFVANAGRIVATHRPQSRLGKAAGTKLDSWEKYWEEQNIAMGTVLKKMLVIVDSLIVKEREQAQKEARRSEMGWSGDDEDDRVKGKQKAQTQRKKEGRGSSDEERLSQWGLVF